MIQMAFGNVIKKYRKKLGLSQEKFALKISMTEYIMHLLRMAKEIFH